MQIPLLTFQKKTINVLYLCTKNVKKTCVMPKKRLRSVLTPTMTTRLDVYFIHVVVMKPSTLQWKMNKMTNLYGWLYYMCGDLNYHYYHAMVTIAWKMSNKSWQYFPSNTFGIHVFIIAFGFLYPPQNLLVILVLLPPFKVIIRCV